MKTHKYIKKDGRIYYAESEARLGSLWETWTPVLCGTCKRWPDCEELTSTTAANIAGTCKTGWEKG